MIDIMFEIPDDDDNFWNDLPLEDVTNCQEDVNCNTVKKERSRQEVARPGSVTPVKRLRLGVETVRPGQFDHVVPTTNPVPVQSLTPSHAINTVSHVTGSQRLLSQNPTTLTPQTDSYQRPVDHGLGRSGKTGSLVGAEHVNSDHSRTYSGSSDTPCHPTPKRSRRKFPGPAGLLPRLAPGQNIDTGSVVSGVENPEENKLKDAAVIFSSQSSDDMFSDLPWRTLLSDLQDDGVELMDKFSIAGILAKASKKKLARGKVAMVFAVIETLDVRGLDASVTLRDRSGRMQGTIHRDVLRDYETELQAGTVLVLRQVSVISLTNRNHYLNITPANMVTLYVNRSSSLQKVQCVSSQDSLHSVLLALEKQAQQEELDTSRTLNHSTSVSPLLGPTTPVGSFGQTTPVGRVGQITPRFGQTTPVGRMGQITPRFGQTTPVGRMGQTTPVGRFGQTTPVGRFGQTTPVGRGATVSSQAARSGTAEQSFSSATPVRLGANQIDSSRNFQTSFRQGIGANERNVSSGLRTPVMSSSIRQSCVLPSPATNLPQGGIPVTPVQSQLPVTPGTGTGASSGSTFSRTPLVHPGTSQSSTATPAPGRGQLELRSPACTAVSGVPRTPNLQQTGSGSRASVQQQGSFNSGSLRIPNSANCASLRTVPPSNQGGNRIAHPVPNVGVNSTKCTSRTPSTPVSQVPSGFENNISSASAASHGSAGRQTVGSADSGSLPQGPTSPSVARSKWTFKGKKSPGVPVNAVSTVGGTTPSAKTVSSHTSAEDNLWGDDLSDDLLSQLSEDMM